MAKKALVVDDDPDCLTLIGEILMLDGYAVTRCSKSTKAHHLAKELLPDVMVLDLVMPEKDGWQVVVEFKSDTTTANIPIVVSSVSTELSRRSTELRNFGCEIVPRPFEIDDLFRAVQRVISASQADETVGVP